MAVEKCKCGHTVYTSIDKYCGGCGVSIGNHKEVDYSNDDDDHQEPDPRENWDYDESWLQHHYGNW